MKKILILLLLGILFAGCAEKKEVDLPQSIIDDGLSYLKLRRAIIANDDYTDSFHATMRIVHETAEEYYRCGITYDKAIVATFNNLLNNTKGCFKFINIRKKWLMADTDQLKALKTYYEKLPKNKDLTYTFPNLIPHYSDDSETMWNYEVKTAIINLGVIVSRRTSPDGDVWEFEQQK